LPENDKPEAPIYGKTNYDDGSEDDTLPEFLKILGDSAANGQSTKLDKRTEYLNAKMNHLKDLFDSNNNISQNTINNLNSARLITTDNLTNSTDIQCRTGISVLTSDDII